MGKALFMFVSPQSLHACNLKSNKDISTCFGVLVLKKLFFWYFHLWGALWFSCRDIGILKWLHEENVHLWKLIGHFRASLALKYCLNLYVQCNCFDRREVSSFSLFILQTFLFKYDQFQLFCPLRILWNWTILSL